MSEKLGFVTAMASEALIFPAALVHDNNEKLLLKKGRLLSGKNFLCVLSGVGKNFAQKGALCALNKHVSLLVSIGVAGGLDSSLKAGDIILVHKTVTCDNETCLSDDSLNSKVEKSFISSGLSYNKGIVLTTKKALLDRTSKSKAHHLTGACAVDMESYWVGLMAQKHHIPFTSIRAISDTLKQTVAFDPSVVINTDGQVRGKAVAAAIIKQPSVLFYLPQMAVNFYRALNSLKNVIKTL
jgi:adenosylhomocysteine nucleosidase